MAAKTKKLVKKGALSKKEKPVPVEESDEVRCKKLREGVIKMMRKAVKDEPDVYDADRLQEAIDKVNSVPDENLDAFLILNHHLSILCKQVEFNKEEIKKLLGMLKKNFKITDKQQCPKDDRTRDDFQFLIKNGHDQDVVVWVAKIRPLFEDFKPGYYNILCCGDMISMVNENFKDMDSMLAKLKTRIENYKG